MHIDVPRRPADRAYLERYHRPPRQFEEHLKSTRTRQWAAPSTGLPAEEIEARRKTRRAPKRTYFRLGFGFDR